MYNYCTFSNDLKNCFIFWSKKDDVTKEMSLVKFYELVNFYSNNLLFIQDIEINFKKILQNIEITNVYVEKKQKINLNFSTLKLIILFFKRLFLSFSANTQYVNFCFNIESLNFDEWTFLPLFVKT